jgi:glycosyltransferase involved in cell wall biosynthesis
MQRLRYLDLVLFCEERIASREALLDRHAYALGYLPHLPGHYAPVAMQAAAFAEDFQWQNTAFKVRHGSNRALAVPLRLFRAIRSLRPQIVLVHSFIHAWQILFLKLCLPRNCKLLVQNHAEEPFPGLKSWFQKWAAPGVDAFLFASEQQAQAWRQRGIFGEHQRVFEVMEGSTPFAIKPRAACRALLKLAEGPVFLWVGRLDMNKDPLTVLRAFLRLKQRSVPFKLYMAYSQNEMERQVKDFISAHGLDDQVVRLGAVAHPELETWYNAADFFVLGSHHEGSGYALCEALACGCVPIVTDIPSFRKMTNDGRIGWLFEPDNDLQLSGLLQQALTQDAEPMRQAARLFFEEKLSHAAIARDIDVICRKLLGV